MLGRGLFLDEDKKLFAYGLLESNQARKNAVENVIGLCKTNDLAVLVFSDSRQPSDTIWAYYSPLSKPLFDLGPANTHLLVGIGEHPMTDYQLFNYKATGCGQVSIKIDQAMSLLGQRFSVNVAGANREPMLPVNVQCVLGLANPFFGLSKSQFCQETLPLLMNTTQLPADFNGDEVVVTEETPRSLAIAIIVVAAMILILVVGTVRTLKKKCRRHR